MGAKSSKKNIVADTMVEDDSESYNLINIHTPTAGMGISILCVLVGVVCVYRLYRCMVRADCRPSKTGARGRRFPVLPDTAVDMVNHIGHAMPTQGVVVRGGDARNSYWTPKEDPCMTCLEDAWTEHGHRRTRARFGQPDLVHQSVGPSVCRSVGWSVGLSEAFIVLYRAKITVPQNLGKECL